MHFRGDREYDLGVEDEISFAEASVDVAVNARDPLAAARAIARREIQLADCAGHHLATADFRERQIFFSTLNPGHSATLLTPWREPLA